jgi:hypothetical protein
MVRILVLRTKKVIKIIRNLSLNKENVFFFEQTGKTEKNQEPIRKILPKTNRKYSEMKRSTDFVSGRSK